MIIFFLPFKIQGGMQHWLIQDDSFYTLSFNHNLLELNIELSHKLLKIIKSIQQSELF